MYACMLKHRLKIFFVTFVVCIFYIFVIIQMNLIYDIYLIIYQYYLDNAILMNEKALVLKHLHFEYFNVSHI